MVTRVLKCFDKMFGANMEQFFSVIFYLLLFISELYAQSPCPAIFNYQNDGGVITGLVRIPPSGPTSSILTRVNFSIPARLPSTYVGSIVPIDPKHGLQRYNQGQELIYRVHFPVTSPLPRLTSLVVNGYEMCYGPVDIPGPNQYVSTISLQHILYLRGNTLFNPFDIPESYESEDEPLYDSGHSISRPFQNNKRPDQTQNYPEYTTEMNLRPTRPTVNYQPSPRPPNNHYPVQPLPPPVPQQPANYNPYETEKPPQQPDYNLYEPDRNLVQRPTPKPTRPVVDSGRIECGIVAGGNDKVPLIMNGQSYERGEWPWLVAIYKRNDGSLTFKCGGTLISDRHVVTAAHCMKVRSAVTSMRDIVVKVGVYNLEDWGDDQIVTRTLESATIHESYNSTSLANDILVFTLDKSVEFNINIRPACLWEGKTDLNWIVGGSGVVAGWGKNELGPAGHGEPRMVRLPIVSTSNCRASKPDFHKLTSDTTLCAGDRNGIGPCLGDSGGGLYVLDGGRWRLRGVVSLSLQPASGERTCDLDQYVIFTDAAKYIRWIRNIVQSSQI